MLEPWEPPGNLNQMRRRQPYVSVFNYLLESSVSVCFVDGIRFGSASGLGQPYPIEFEYIELHCSLSGVSAPEDRNTVIWGGCVGEWEPE